jgi:hypothetical protein
VELNIHRGTVRDAAKGNEMFGQDKKSPEMQ